MKILINALAGDSGGSATYWRGLLPALGRQRSDTEFMVLRSAWQTFWNFSVPPNIKFVEVPALARRSVSRRILWEQAVLPGLCRARGVDVLYSPADVTCLAAACPSVVAIRNFNPYVGGLLGRGVQYYVNRKIVLRSLSWLSVRRAARVIFVSDYSRRIVCSALGVSTARAVVVPHGLSAAFSAPAVPARWIEELPRPYLLTVSDIAAHKNYPFLLTVFAELAKSAWFRHHLVIAGEHRFAPHVAEARRRAAEAGLTHRVHFVGPVSFADLPALNQQADAVVFPSLLETFGHPVLEAMASGIPVIASNAAAIPETGGAGAVYFDPTDVPGAVRTVAGVLLEPAARRRLVAAGRRRASELSWDECARKTADVLENASTPRLPSPRRRVAGGIEC